MHLTDPKSPPADEQTASSDGPTDDLTIPTAFKRQDIAEPEKVGDQEDEMSKKTANAAEAKGAKPKKARTPAKAKDARKTAPRRVKAAAKPKAERKAKSPKARKEPKPPKAAKQPKEAKAPRADTKSAQLEAMLRSAKGTTIAEVIEAFGWLPHTARSAISAGIGKKRGLTIVTEKDDKRGRVYRIAA